jgi:hypothetical protein
MATTHNATQKSAIAWFASMIKGLKGSAGLRKRVGIDFFDPSKDIALGQFFIFHYDALHKDTLPYWDKFPFALIIDADSKGFLGLNFHYLPPKLRKVVIDVLLKYKRLGGTPRANLKVTYPLLKGLAQSKLFQPLVHRYLYSQVRSNFIIVHEGAWENAAMLPVQKFEGASSQYVWSQR